MDKGQKILDLAFDHNRKGGASSSSLIIIIVGLRLWRLSIPIEDKMTRRGISLNNYQP